MVTRRRPVQFMKQLLDSVVSFAGKAISLMLVQPSKAPPSKTFRLSGSVKLSNAVHVLKALLPMVVIVEGSTTSFRFLHRMKMPLGSTAISPGITARSSESQSLNTAYCTSLGVCLSSMVFRPVNDSAPIPIVSTVSGMSMAFNCL